MEQHKIDLLSLPKETLVDIITMFSKNAIAIDGLWFTDVEQKFGLDTALEIDEWVWGRYGAIEAKRIKQMIKIDEEAIAGLSQALNFQIWSPGIGDYEFPEVTENKVVFNVTSCRPQRARVRDGRGEFPCKPVGAALFKEFAKVIDPRFKMKCLLSPPDPHPEDLWCSWEFSLE